MPNRHNTAVANDGLDDAGVPPLPDLGGINLWLLRTTDRPALVRAVDYVLAHLTELVQTLDSSDLQDDQGGDQGEAPEKKND